MVVVNEMASREQYCEERRSGSFFLTPTYFTSVYSDLKKEKELPQDHLPNRHFKTPAVWELVDLCPHRCFKFDGIVCKKIKA